MKTAESISVVIPVINEASGIARILKSLRRQFSGEIIISDGGSRDKTILVCRQYDVVITQGERGRAHQMNAGARIAKGETLLFLHADTCLPESGCDQIKQTMEDQTVVGGRFRVRFDQKKLRYQIIAFYTQFKTFSYGDQAFFVRRHIFDELGGYDTNVVFEDVDFYRKLMKRGRTRILRDAVITSTRRFENQGFLKQKAINVCLATMVQLGFNPKNAAKRWYPDIR